MQAVARAERSRDPGNHVRLRHWRETARLIGLPAGREVTGTIH